MCFLPQFLDIETVRDSVHRDQQLTLFVLGVNTLGNSDDTDAVMGKPLMYVHDIGKGPAEA